LKARGRVLCPSSQSRLLADLDNVSFRVADLEALRATAVVDGARRSISPIDKLVGLFQICAEHQRMVVCAVVSSPPNLGLVAEQDGGLVRSWQLQRNIGGERTIPIDWKFGLFALENCDPPLLLSLNV